MRYLAAKAPAGGVYALLAAMARGEKTGTLELDTAKGVEYLYFVDGKLYLRRSPDQRTIRLLKLLAENEGSDSAEVDRDPSELLSSTAELLSALKIRSYRFVEGFRLEENDLVGPLPTGPAVEENGVRGGVRAAGPPSPPPPDLPVRSPSAPRRGPAARSTTGPVGSSTAIRGALAWPRDASILSSPRRPDEAADPSPASPGSPSPSPSDSEAESSQRDLLSMDSSLLESTPAKRQAAKRGSAKRGPVKRSPAKRSPLRAESSASSRDARPAAATGTAVSGPPLAGSLPVSTEVLQPVRPSHRELQGWYRHFGLVEEPFSLTPDPAFLFLSDSHAEALAGLKLSLLERRGLCVMTGEVGTGKTTLLYSLFSTVGSEIETAYVHNPTLAFDQLLETILRDLNVTPESTRRVDLLNALNEFLTASATKSKTVALVIDEAQNLSNESFEFLRLLLNFETYDSKLLQIFLVGQPELGERLRSHSLRQIADRIAVRCRVDALTRADCREYVRHRLESARGRDDLFTGRALSLVARKSKGIPRRINVLCHNAMLFAYAEGERIVRRSFVAEALRDSRG